MRATGRWAWRTGTVFPLLILTGVLLLGGGAVADDEAPQAAWTTLSAGLEVTGITSLCIHPKNPDVLWAHVHGAGVARSIDGGQNWEVRQEGIDPRHVPGPRDACEISLDPRDEKVLWVVTKGEVYKSEDRGETWTNKSTGALRSYSWDRSSSVMAIRGVVVNPDKSASILAGTRTGGAWRGGLFASTDGGDTWEQIAGTDLKESELGHDAWPIVLDPNTDKNIAVGASNGFWFSDDRGRRFRRADPGDIGWHDIRVLTKHNSRGRDLFACDGRGLWGSRDGGKRWEKKPLLDGDCVTAYLHPHSRRRLYAVLRDRGLFVSDDARHAKWAELGHASACIKEILAHPKTKSLLYFASPVSGLHISTDEGKTLEPVKSNVETQVPGVALVVPHPVDADRVMALTVRGAVFVSQDRGATWERAGRLGTAPAYLRGDAEVEGTWWAAGHVLLRSPDNGGTWETVYKPTDPEDLILDVVRENGGYRLLLQRARTVVTSKDGKDWQESKAPTKAPGSWASAFALDPANADHILLATRTLTGLWSPKDQEGGPWESWDGGKRWKQLREGLFESAKKPKRNWNRGTLMAYDPGTNLAFYAAEGLGLFARLVVDPKGKKPEVSPLWVEISPHDLPSLRVNSMLLDELPEDAGTAVLVQAEGENDTRTFVRTTTARVLEHVKAAMAKDGTEQDALPPLWDDLPDAPAAITALVADPHIPGRYLTSDRDGLLGVLAFGVPGAVVAEGPGEEGAVEPAAVGPSPAEGLLAFSAGADAQVRVWGLAEGKVLKGLAGHAKEVLAIALAADESLVATGGADRTVRLFDGMDGSASAVVIPPLEGTVNTLAFHPDSKRLYAGLEQSWTVVEIDVATGATRTFDGHTGGVLALGLTPDGTKLVTGSRDRTIRVWDIATAKTALKIDIPKEVLALVLSADGTQVITGGRGADIGIYDLELGAEVKRAAVQGAFVSDLAISPDGTSLYVAGDKGVVALDAKTLAPLAVQPEGPEMPVFCVALSHDGTWIVAGDSENGIWMWRNDRAKPWWSNGSAHAGAIHALVLTPDVVGGAGDAAPIVPPEAPKPPADG